MRVLFILDRLGVGGAERHTVELANSLTACGIQSYILTYQPDASRNLPLGDAEGRIIRINEANLLNPLGWRKLAVEISSAGPDLIFAVNQKALVLAATTRRAWSRGQPLWNILHTTLVTGRTAALRTAVLKNATRSSDGVIFVSSNQAAHWRRQGLRPRESTTIVNGVDSKFYAPRTSEGRATSRALLGIPTDAYVIGMCAQFRPEKNHKQAVDALRALVRENPSTRLLLVGDGPTRSEIATYVHASDLGNHVTFTGEQSDVREFVQAFDIGLICSTSVETLSLAALETMAMGIPMVMSNIGGASEIIAPGENGYLFKAGDTSALLDRLRLLQSPAELERFSRAARATVESQFDRETMVWRYAQLARAAADKVH